MDGSWQERIRQYLLEILHWRVITAEVSEQVKKNTIATGCCFAEVEVDIKLGKIKILHIINVHDSGKLINPKLAEMQVQGGMSMGMGYGLSEQLILDEKTGRPLNGTLLDYKLMTMMDTPDIKADFVELDDLSETKHWVNRRQFRVHRQSVMQYFMQQV
mgnify:CR=1 FL=1